MLYAAVLLVSLFVQTDSLLLSGTVYDPSGMPAAGARVHLEEPTAQQQWNAVTQPDGTFRFDRLAFGTYEIKVQAEGYYETAAEIRLESSKTVEFTLAAAETLQQEVDVIARPEAINVDSASPQDVANDEVIQNLPYAGRQNFLNALPVMPGVVQDSANQLHIHGARPDQIRYQLDGLNMTDASSGGLSASIPIDAIESVDMDLANYSPEFGRASGGVVRVHSQFIGDKYRFNITDFVPGWDFRQKSIAEFSPRLSFSGPIVRNKFWFMYSSTVRYIHSFLEELQTPVNERTRTQSSVNQLLKLQWNLKESHVLTFEALHNYESLTNSGLSVIRPLETTTNVHRRDAVLGISDRQTVSGKLFETTLQWTDHNDSDAPKGAQPLEIRPGAWSGNYYSDRRGRARRFHAAETAAWEQEGAGLTQRLKVGAEFDWTDSNIQWIRRPFQMFDAQGNLASLVTFTGAETAAIRNREYGAFVQDRFVFGPKFQTEVGVRFDRESVAGRNDFGPRASFSYLPFRTPRTKLSGGVGLFYDDVPLMDLALPNLQRRITTVYDAGVAVSAPAAADVRLDPALRDPHALHWNIAWENEWAPRWVTRIDYIRKTSRNDVRLAAEPNGPGFDLVFNNSGRSAYHALEFTLDRPIRTNLRFQASYVYSSAMARPSLDPDFPDPAVERIDDAPVEWDTPHRFVGWGYFPLPFDLSGSFSVEARSGFSFTAVDDLNRVAAGYNDQRFPTFFSTSASIEKQMPLPFSRGKRVAVRVGVTNLFNRYNPRFVDANIDSPTFLAFSDSSNRHFSARLRIVKK